MYGRRRKIDGKRAKRKFTGRKHLHLDTKIRGYTPRRFVDPTSGFKTPQRTLARPVACPEYKPGCTYANCDGCKRIHALKKSEVKEG